MSYSCNDNQNYFVSETGRTTSRVLNPPGGASSFSLGSDPSPVPVVAPAAGASSTAASSNGAPSSQEQAVLPSVTMESTVVNEPPANSASTVLPPPSESVAQTSQPSQSQQPAPPVSSNAFASGANMNGANVITGRPTSRVLAPPGGHSALGGSLW